MSNNAKLITCISPLKKGLDVLTVLHDRGIESAIRSTANGSSVNTFKEVEMEIIEVLVDEKDADEIFALLYELFEIDKPHHGILFQKNIKRSSKFILPNVDELKTEH
jgi:hypothetical protein